MQGTRATGTTALRPGSAPRGLPWGHAPHWHLLEMASPCGGPDSPATRPTAEQPTPWDEALPSPPAAQPCGHRLHPGPATGKAAYCPQSSAGQQACQGGISACVSRSGVIVTMLTTGVHATECMLQTTSAACLVLAAWGENPRPEQVNGHLGHEGTSQAS